MTLKPLYFFSLCFFFNQRAWSQEPVPQDTTKKVEILAARKLEFLKTNDTTELQILAGNVKLRQGSTLFYCDSCIINNRIHVLEAFGNVHINDADTANAILIISAILPTSGLLTCKKMFVSLMARPR
jgi:Organic solvent tolerance protein OstA